MSEKFTDLVFGLAPVECNLRRSRARFVLVALAVKADDEGRCEASNGALCGWTGLGVNSVRTALWDLREAALIESTYANGQAAPEYRLMEDELADRQARTILRERYSTYILTDFGLTQPTADRLVRAGWDTVEKLGAELARFEAQSDMIKGRGLAAFLCIRYVGEGKARQLAAAYRAYSQRLKHER